MRRSGKLLKDLAEVAKIPSAADKNPKLKFQRSCLVRDVYPYKKKRGKNVCRRCGKKPPGKRIHWCSDACVYDAMIRCTPSEAMKWVRVRDKGVCAKCGLDTKTINFDKKKELGFNPYKSFWEADHVVPVVEGGGHCGLDNYQTLCIPCHKLATKELMTRHRLKKNKDK